MLESEEYKPTEKMLKVGETMCGAGPGASATPPASPCTMELGAASARGGLPRASQRIRMPELAACNASLPLLPPSPPPVTRCCAGRFQVRAAQHLLSDALHSLHAPAIERPPSKRFLEPRLALQTARGPHHHHHPRRWPPLAP